MKGERHRLSKYIKKKNPIGAKQIRNLLYPDQAFVTFFFVLLNKVALFPIGVVFSFFPNYLNCELEAQWKKKRWMTVEINIFFSYAIFYFCPKRTYSRPKYLEKLHMMVYTFFFRKELAQKRFFLCY
jgi:hypothetical protein